MFNIILVAAGGATGAILRYTLTNLSKNFFSSSIYGTLSVNILGSFLIGYLITSIYMKSIPEDFVKFFLIIGLLGSFTTFSAFSYEVVDLINSKKYATSLTYILISIFICIISAYFGTLLNKW